MEREQLQNDSIIDGFGSIFDCGCEALVNPVNCVGVMGKGLAKEFKNRFPEMFKEYRAICRMNNLFPGVVHPWKNPDNIWPNWIINFPTKVYWKEASTTQYIHDGMYALIDFIDSQRINSIAIPALGCGLGNLKYSLVKAIIKQYAEELPNVTFLLFGPKDEI